MSRGKPRDPAKERFWRRMLQRWRRSGLSVRAFCQQQRLSEARFYAWRRTLSRRDEQLPAFVPVQILPPEEPVVTTPAGGSGLELVLPGGRILRIACAFDEPTLRRLLAVLEEPQA